MRKLHTYFITITSFLEYKLCQIYNNVLIVCSIYVAEDKKPFFLADNKKKNYSRNFIKKSLNLIETKAENRLFYINKNLLVNNR